MSCRIVKAKPYHIPWIANHAREADRVELWNYAMVSPMTALLRSFEASEIAWTGLIDGEPVAMFGVVRSGLLSNMGRPWLIGTDKIEKHQFAFLRRNKPYIRKMNEVFPVMENYIDPDNTVAIKWLEWMNFVMEEARPMGPFRKMFVKFSMGA